MKEELKTRFNELCEEASKEQDTSRLLELVRQINQMALNETTDDRNREETSAF
jgi:hypothetical protein